MGKKALWLIRNVFTELDVKQYVFEGFSVSSFQPCRLVLAVLFTQAPGGAASPLQQAWYCSTM